MKKTSSNLTLILDGLYNDSFYQRLLVPEKSTSVELS